MCVTHSLTYPISATNRISERLPSLSELSVEVNVDELEASASAPRYIKRQKEKKEEKNLELTSRKDVVSERTWVIKFLGLIFFKILDLIEYPHTHTTRNCACPLCFTVTDTLMCERVLWTFIN